MAIPDKKIYPRTGDKEIVYLKDVITNLNITDWEVLFFSMWRSVSF